MTYNELIAFLDRQLASGQLNPQTGVSRRSSVIAMLRIARDEELQDISKIDIDNLTSRFQEHVRDKYKAETVKSYRGRLETAIREYSDAERLAQHQKKESSSPMFMAPGYRPSPLPNYVPAYPQSPSSVLQRNQQDSASAQEITFPIPLREDVIVYIKGLPRDLTKDEATKISRVVAALTAEDT